MFPQDKGPYDPQVKIPVPPTTHFSLRTVKYAGLIKNTENNLNLEEEYIFIMVINNAIICAAKVSYF